MAPTTAVSRAVSVRIARSTFDRLHAHLFPGDGDEHGAVLVAGISTTPRGTRLLVRDVVPAIDGVDYVPGARVYRALRAEFVRDRALEARDSRLAYIAVHNHAGSGRAAFSAIDMAAHERGYPALLDIVRGQPVGALVFAEDAVAGDIWWPGGARATVTDFVVIGSAVMTMRPDQRRREERLDPRFDRQARLFGEAGQRLLRGLKVGVIGAGGVGILLVEYLARLGVGSLVVADPDRVDATNLPRLPGARPSDAGWWFRSETWPTRLRSWAASRALPKVHLARRIAREAAMGTMVEAIIGDVRDPTVARRFTDCDFVFLAADGDGARLVFNALVMQYLIPGYQIGSKVPVDPQTGAVGDVHSVVRPVWPDSGCLWCNGLISPARLAEETLSPQERRAQRYVDDPEVAAPSVITLNATAASQAANDFLFSITGLVSPGTPSDYMRLHPRTREIKFDSPRHDRDCPECGPTPRSRFARGDTVRLPTRLPTSGGGSTDKLTQP